jgi:hypothetical protein
MKQLKSFKTVINNFVEDKLKELLKLELYVVISSNNDYTVNIKDVTSKQQFENVKVLGAGLGHGKGLLNRYSKNDIVLVGFLGGEFSQPIVLGSLFDVFSPKKDSVPLIKEGELLLLPKINGAYIYIKTDNSIVVKNSNGEFSLGVDGRLTINNAYSFPLVDGNNGQVLKSNGSGSLYWANDNI